MLLVTFLAMSFPFGSAEIQMCCTIHNSRIPWLNTKFFSLPKIEIDLGKLKNKKLKDKTEYSITNVFI